MYIQNMKNIPKIYIHKYITYIHIHTFVHTHAFTHIYIDKKEQQRETELEALRMPTCIKKT